MSTFIGIDLGTSNCAVAIAHGDAPPETLPITQVASDNGVAEKSLLPSALYIPSPAEFPNGAPGLPWQQEPRHWFCGDHARARGALQPDRLIASAKSWLCHPHVDRRGAILPWQSATVAEKWSPPAVSEALLAHLLGNLRAAGHSPEGGHPVVTVPASFDEAARGLTLEAARAAGLGEATLLEEPQAAFYAWLGNHSSDWRTQVSAGDLVLVCDVGGGTADFSLISVSGREGNLALERVAVGEHLLLGGDNMDLALAHHTASQLEAAGTALDDWQFLSLVQSVRAAKEALLSDNAPAEFPLAIPSRSSRLVASTISASLSRADAESIVLDGFFPLTAAGEMPQLRRAGGLRESGLPYAADAALSKHLSRFLSRARENISSSPALLAAAGGLEKTGPGPLATPDAVLFNGGVFNAPRLRARVLELLSGWSGRPVRELSGARPDHAVAIGAAIYSRLRATGKGLRIKSGTARSYYIGMESSAMAVPGRRPAAKALCVAPQGMEEGTSHAIEGREFLLHTGEASEFRFFQSEIRAGDQPGEILPDASVLEESAKLQVEIPPPAGHQPGEEVPVRLESRVTELGNLELHFIHTAAPERWKLEFHVRLQ
jgi:molecular chaperone DnaK (HSP70)